MIDDLVHYLFVDDLVHDLEAFHRFLLSDADKLLLQRYRSEAVVEEEQSLRRLNSKEVSHIFIVWQRSTKANQPNFLLGRFNVANGSEIKIFK